MRIQRALEVYRLTGKPISVWWQEHGSSGAAGRLGVRLTEVALLAERRADLAARLEHRFRGMLQRGLVEEVAALKARGDLSPALPSMRAVGYRQVWEYLEGQGDREALVERAVAATRTLARRQLTWLRRWPEVTVVAVPEMASPRALAERIARHAQLEIS